MQRSMTKLAAAVLLFSLAASASQSGAFAQGRPNAQAPRSAPPSPKAQPPAPARRAGVPLDQDAATRGSVPYNKAVKNYLAKLDEKIVGGKPATAKQFPWQVSLGISWVADPYWAHFCGGSVHSDRWIVTAAHCVDDLSPSQVIITAGTHRLVAGATRRNIKRIIVHKGYVAATSDNDIALLELLDPLPLGEHISAVPLLTPAAEGTILIKDTPLAVTGWGATQEGGQKVAELRYLDNVPLVDRPKCNEPLSYDGQITDNMICAGKEAGGEDSCQGDSGGPLTAETTTAPKLAGVVSWGEGCARPNRVGVYTRVPNYVTWVGACVSNLATCNQ